MDHQISSELPPVQAPNRGEQFATPSAEAPHGAGYMEIQQSGAVEKSFSSPQISQAQASAASTAFATPSTKIGNTQAAGAAGMPAIADDTDLIEKEWVLKAKEIVNRTKDDPYVQNKEVNRMKADYMKKRYNKEIKTPED